MNEYRLTWCQCPHVHHTTHTLFVRAASPEDARTLARNHIERRFGIEWFSIFSVDLAPQIPAGEVMGETQ